nr:MAG TPA: hypothetical protein [Caudoviricetes sp.]
MTTGGFCCLDHPHTFCEPFPRHLTRYRLVPSPGDGRCRPR